MQASPYDLSAYGHPPVAVETPDGKAEYVRRQRGFAERAADLRGRLLGVCGALLAADPTTAPAGAGPGSTEPAGTALGSSATDARRTVGA
jgi:hypothetical protein